MAIYVSTGGKKETIYGYINITYPSGSTLTCSNGTKTLKAKNTNGTWVFIIPASGTWTVTCTNGTSTKTKAFNISTKWQHEVATITY